MLDAFALPLLLLEAGAVADDGGEGGTGGGGGADGKNGRGSDLIEV